MRLVRVMNMLVLLLLVSVGVAAQTAQAAHASQTAQEGDLSAYLDPAILLDLMEDPPDDFFLVDVRTPAEYESGHIPGASNTELAIIAEEPPVDDLDATIVVYCRSGSRSARAAAALRALGYTRVLDWGGVNRWPYELETVPQEQ